MSYALALLATQANATTTRLRLEGEINEESITPLVDGLSNAPHGKGDVVVIEINSPGGEVDSGFRLVKAIERYPSKVICVVDGEADSMASYVLVSCDVRAMTKRSMVMIHQPAIGGDGPGRINEFDNIIGWLMAEETAMFEHYAGHMHITVGELRSRCDGGREFWMDWHGAKKYGAVDMVVDRVADAMRTASP